MTTPTQGVHPGPIEPHDPPPPPPPPRDDGPPRGRTAAAVGAGALVLMLGAGVVGGWVGTQLDDDNAGTAPPTQPAVRVEHGSFASIVRTVEPSVVSIKTQNAEGSGVIFDTAGHIVTNNHVVATATGNMVNIVFNDGSTRQATIVGTDPRSDLAVVKVDGVSNVKPAIFGDSNAARVGDDVLALGSPLGLQGTVTSGIVSAKDRTIDESDQQSSLGGGTVTSIAGLLQTDAAINPGNSGGALVNTAGDVVGINTAIASSGGSDGNIGVGFAIPSNTAKSVAKQLIKGEKIHHPYLGVAIAAADDSGAVIQQVEPGSPAAKAGLQPGDLITKVGNLVVQNPDDLTAAVQSTSVGQRIKLTFVRNGDQHAVTVTIGDAP